MEQEDYISVLLKKADLKNTPARRAILEVFLKYDFALSYHDIEKMVNKTLDKVTIYRTLKSYEEKSVIHQVLDTSKVIKYALCSDHCAHGHHHDLHGHFQCNQCDHTYCLDHEEVPSIPLPQGYYATDVSILVRGLCKNCA